VRKNAGKRFSANIEAKIGLFSGQMKNLALRIAGKAIQPYQLAMRTKTGGVKTIEMNACRIGYMDETMDLACKR